MNLIGGFKNRLKEALYFLILSSFFIAIVASLVLYFSFLLFNTYPRPKMLLASFFVTLSIYNINKLTDIKEDAINIPKRADFLKNRKDQIIFLCVFSYVIALVLGSLESVLAVFILLIPLASGVIYSVKLFNGIRLKDIPAAKNITVTLSLVVLATFLAKISLNISPIMLFLIFNFFFLKLFVNTVLFDIRDVEGDKKAGTRTIPVVIGIKKTRNLLLTIHSSFIIWLIVSLYLGFFTIYLPVIIFAIIYGYAYILYFCSERKKIEKNDFSYDIIVDGEWIYLAIFGFILNYL